MATGEIERVMVSVLLLGGITLVPFALKLVRDRAERRRDLTWPCGFPRLVLALFPISAIRI